MGYAISMNFSGVVIPKHELENAVEALKKLPKKLMPGYDSNIKDILMQWSFQVDFQINGDARIFDFTSRTLGDEADALAAIAPFVDPEAEITCEGGANDFWKWTFKGGKLRQHDGHIVYDP